MDLTKIALTKIDLAKIDKQSRRTRRRLEIVLLIALIAVAITLRTARHGASEHLAVASLAELQSVVQRDPYNGRAFYYLAMRWRQIGKLRQADEALQRAATLDTDDERSWLAWAALKSTGHRDADAIQILTPFVQHHPRSAKAHLALAWALDRTQARHQALTEAKRAAELDPKNAEALRLAASNAEALGLLQDAENSLRQAISVAPDDGGAEFDMGDFLTRQSRYSDAVSHYRNAARLLPTEPRASLALGRALLKTAHTPADIDEARASLAASARLNPRDLRVWVALGEALIRESRWDEARKALLHRNLLPPPLPEVALACSYNLEHVYEHLGDSAGARRESARHAQILGQLQAMADLMHAIGARPDDTALRLQLARLSAQNADYAAADALYRKLLQMTPDLVVASSELAGLEQAHPEAARQFAGSHLQEIAAPPTAPAALLLQDAERLRADRHYSEAKAAYARALTADPQSAAACLGLGLTLDAMGDHKGAFALVARAADLQPDLAAAQKRLAEWYQACEFPNEARLRWESVVRSTPGDAEAWHSLGQICATSHNYVAEAEDALRRAAGLAPTNATYLLDQAEFLADSDRSGEAEAIYRRALTVAPASEETLSRGGGFLASVAQTSAGQSEAQGLLRRALAMNPHNGYTLFSIGSLLLATHDEKRAAPLLQEAARLSPATVVAWARLASAYRRLGRLDAADAAQANARKCEESFLVYSRVSSKVTEEPGNPDLRLNFARLSASNGENAQAINQYLVCLHLDPRNSAARHELDALRKRLSAEGRMPPMDLYNMMTAAMISHRKFLSEGQSAVGS